MRRFYKLIISAVLCMAAAYSCGDPIEEEKKTAALELLDKLVTAEAEGGTMMIGFVITNPDGSGLQGRCDDDWCHSFEFPEEGMMTFAVEPNTGTDSRITSIYVRYGEIEKKFTLSQAGGGENLEAIATMDFDISYDINGPEVKMTVNPEYKNVRYYFAYSTKAEIDEIGEDNIQAVIKANVQKFLQVEVSAMVNYSGYTVTQALDFYTGYGKRSASMTINARTDYVGWACAVSNEITVISDVVMKEFRTGDVAPSDNQISVNIDNVNCDRVSFSVNTTNEDQYAVYVLSADQVEGKSDEEIVELFNTTPDVTVFLQFGDYSSTQVGLEEDTDYYVLAYGYKWGMANTAICKEKFRTIKYEGGTPSFSFNMEKVTNIGLKGSIGCSPSTFLYYTDYCEADATAKDILSELEDAIDWYVNEAGYYHDRISLMRVIGTRGTCGFEYADEFITPETGYKLYAIAIDETTGEFCTDVVFSETYRTPEVSSVTVNADYKHYFDAFEIAITYPESGYDKDIVNGYALLPLSIEKDEDVAEFYVAVFTDDLSDTSYPTDEDLFASLYKYGQHNINPVFVLCEYNIPLTISSVAIDKNGNRGKVQRTVIELPHDETSDVEGFEEYLSTRSTSGVTAAAADRKVAEKRPLRLETMIKKDINE